MYGAANSNGRKNQWGSGCNLCGIGLRMYQLYKYKYGEGELRPASGLWGAQSIHCVKVRLED